MTEKTKKIIVGTGVLCIITAAVVVANTKPPAHASTEETVTVTPSATTSATPTETPQPTIAVKIVKTKAEPVVAEGLANETQTTAAPTSTATVTPVPTPAPTSTPVPNVPAYTPNVEKPEAEIIPVYEEPPAATPAPTAIMQPSSSQVYVPGFGYVADSGGNQVIADTEMYENGNTIGIMGGE